MGIKNFIIAHKIAVIITTAAVAVGGVTTGVVVHNHNEQLRIEAEQAAEKEAKAKADTEAKKKAEDAKKAEEAKKTEEVKEEDKVALEENSNETKVASNTNNNEKKTTVSNNNSTSNNSAPSNNNSSSQVAPAPEAAPAPAEDTRPDYEKYSQAELKALNMLGYIPPDAEHFIGVKNGQPVYDYSPIDFPDERGTTPDGYDYVYTSGTNASSYISQVYVYVPGTSEMVHNYDVMYGRIVGE